MVVGVVLSRLGVSVGWVWPVVVRYRGRCLELGTPRVEEPVVLTEALVVDLIRVWYFEELGLVMGACWR